MPWRGKGFRKSCRQGEMQARIRPYGLTQQRCRTSKKEECCSMRPAKISENRLYRELSDIFRRKGYDGASYADLMKATGLVKASLYHRFPGGKEEMVDAILSDVDREFSEYVVKPAFEAGAPPDRARKIARRLREFYKSGQQWCLLDTVTLADSPSTREHACRSLEYWIDAFARVGRDAGLSPAIARRRSQEAVAAIEGGLVVSRVLGDRRPFLRSLASLPKRLTAMRFGES